MRELPIAVAGGGIGGLVAAIAMGRTGRAVTLFERAPQFEPIGYGIQLGPNALHTFKCLGLLDQVLSFCSLPDSGVLSDALTNDRLVELPMAGTMQERFGQPYAVVHRSDLHHVLLEACGSLPTVDLRTNFEVVDFEDTGRDVFVEAKSGERVPAAGLVAADGIWSPIRTRLFPDVDPPFTSRYAAFRCVCPIGKVDASLATNVVNLRCGPNFHMIHYPLRNGTLFNLVGVVRVPEAVAMDDKNAVTAHFDEAFAGGCAEVKALLPLIDRSRYWAVSNLTPLREWVHGRVALIGDAAHAMVQAMAQGACQAIEDGYVLAKHLATNETFELALRHFQTERHVRATYTQFWSMYMWEMIHATGGWRDLRRHKLASLSRAEVLSHFDWLYSAAPASELASQLARVPVAKLPAAANG